MNYITKQMIADELNQNIIKPVLDDGELICKIGDNWFYFGDQESEEFENTDPSEISFDVLVNDILRVLDDFREDCDDYGDEYLYYYYYLTENLAKKVDGMTCRFCGSQLYESQIIDEYKYQCFKCDEDFYAFEQEWR